MKPSILLADRELSPLHLRDVVSVDVRNIKSPAWETFLSSCTAEELRLCHVLVSSLEGIDRLRGTTKLTIVWANKVSDLRPVFRMPWLERLELSDLPLVRSLEGIEALQNLSELDISGNLGSLHPPLRLDSLGPIAALTRLKSLSILNARVTDDDISFIGTSFPELRVLNLQTTFDRAQLAYLARRLNAQLEKPIRASLEMNLKCQKCGGTRHLFIGRRMPVLCATCEIARFEKLTNQFDQLVKSF